MTQVVAVESKAADHSRTDSSPPAVVSGAFVARLAAYALLQIRGFAEHLVNHGLQAVSCWARLPLISSVNCILNLLYLLWCQHENISNT